MPSEIDQHDELLTAYLDGELGAEDTRRVEERISQDPAFRERMQELERSWNLLDQLGASTVDDSFTRSTLAMVAVVAQDEVAQVRRDAPRRRRARWLAAALGVAAAALVGYAGVRWWAPDPNAALLADLPLLERFDQYNKLLDVHDVDVAGSVQFLRDLAARKLFAAAPPGASDGPPAGDSPQARQARLAALPAAEREKIRRAQTSFQELPPTQRQMVRDLHAELSRPDNRELSVQLAHYDAWYQSLQFFEQERINAKRKWTERLEEIVRIDKDRWPLALEDMLKVREWFAQYVKDHRPWLVEAWKKDQVDWPEEIKSEERLDWSERRPRYAMQRARHFLVKNPGRRLPDLRKSYELLVPKLSQQAQNAYRRADSPGREKILEFAIQSVFWAGMGPPGPRGPRPPGGERPHRGSDDRRGRDDRRGPPPGKPRPSG